MALSLFQQRITGGNNNYERYDKKTFARFVASALEGVRTVRDNKRVMYFNCPCAFDIETSSFEENGNKRACMYLWAFGLNGLVCFGRTWDEFMDLCRQLTDILALSDTKRLICGVHNLAWEFQFIRKRFTWLKVFSLKERKPIQAITTTGIEFRCTYLLSGYSLAKLGDELQRYKVQKAVGDLDYSLVRHSETPITDRELYYQVQDVKVVMAYLQECIESENGNITYIPLTKTGYVRRYCRNACLYTGKHHRLNKSYNTVIKSLTLTPEAYKMLKRAFQGGFTHASAFASGRLHENVGSFDFCSSYPAVMVAERYPMSAPELVDITGPDDFNKNLKLYNCLFDVEIYGLRPKIFIDHPLSRWMCYDVRGGQEDNGRLVRADHLLTTLTELDFFTLNDFYEWDILNIGTFYRFKRGYLPTSFVKAILKLYQDKTTLKGVENKETEYQIAKGMLNSCYGMAVTDIVRDEILYTDDWETEKPDLVKAIDKYNKGRRRFLFYPWGVWVTAYARYNLFSGIKAFGSDYLYSDTDSIKALNYERHMDYINEYNAEMIEKLKRACKHHGIPEAAIMPKTIKGIEKPLGVYEFEGAYEFFKTLGAKRYLVQKNGQLQITVAGVGKGAAGWLVQRYGNITAAFNAFADGLEFPPEATGKNTHTYIDDEIQGFVTDYLGNTGEYHELSAVHLEGAEYSLSIGKLYAEYLRGIVYE